MLAIRLGDLSTVGSMDDADFWGITRNGSSSADYADYPDCLFVKES
jgi:hypothetical protein